MSGWAGLAPASTRWVEAGQLRALQSLLSGAWSRRRQRQTRQRLTRQAQARPVRARWRRRTGLRETEPSELRRVTKRRTPIQVCVKVSHVAVVPGTRG
jgi:hypothetical protein